MAKIFDMDWDAVDAWLSDKPDIIKQMVEKYPMDRLYQMPDTGKRVFIRAYDEDGSVIVTVSGEFNFVLCDRNVFGIDPATLKECGLPSDDELSGGLYRVY